MAKPTVPASPPTKQQRRARPRAKWLSKVCAEGPFGTKEEFWNQLDEFLVLEAEAQFNNWVLTPYATAAAWFKVPLDEFTRTLSSRSFVKWCEVKAKMRAMLTTRALDPKVTRVLGEMADKDPKGFLEKYFKRAELVGFDKTSIDDVEEINEDEGNQLLEAFTRIWTDLAGGVKPNLHLILPRLLGTGDEEKGPVVGPDAGPAVGDRPDAVPQPDRSDSVGGTVPVAKGQTTGKAKVQLRPGSEPAREDQLAGLRLRPVPGSPAPVREAAQESPTVLPGGGLQEDRGGDPPEIAGFDTIVPNGLQPNDDDNNRDQGTREGK